MNFKRVFGFAIAAMAGSAFTFMLTQNYLTVKNMDAQNNANQPDSNEPMYWVAPMDPNYQRDEPGQSPMGMDLIPVYKKEKNDVGDQVGAVNISPQVINNLGVRTTVVENKRVNGSIKTVGFVQYDEDKLIHIHPRVEGWIEKLHVKATGNPVKKGQPLYEIYSPALVNAQEEFLLALERKNKQLIKASEDRLQALQVPSSLIKNLKRRKNVKQRVIFYAPQSGVIANLNIREGYYVKPGTTLMSVASINTVWVEAEVFERQALQVENNAAVTMTLDYLPGRTWHGKVDYVYPTLDRKTRTLKVRMKFENSGEQLKPNMFSQINISTPDHNALIVPTQSVIRTGNKERVVLALGEGYFKSIYVTVGRYDQEYAEIIDGLNEGDLIVTSAQFLLDSESSKTSDFARMSSPESQVKTHSMHHQDMD